MRGIIILNPLQRFDDPACGTFSIVIQNSECHDLCVWSNADNPKAVARRSKYPCYVRAMSINILGEEVIRNKIVAQFICG